MSMAQVYQTVECVQKRGDKKKRKYKGKKERKKRDYVNELGFFLVQDDETEEEEKKGQGNK